MSGVESYRSVKLIRPSERIDSSNYRQFYREAIAVLENLKCQQDNTDVLILVDMQNVKILDIRGLGVLASLLKAAQRNNQKMALCSINQNIKFLLKATAIYKWFDILSSDRYVFRELEQTSFPTKMPVKLSPQMPINLRALVALEAAS
jgi:anti-sigma B factor antagonist